MMIDRPQGGPCPSVDKRIRDTWLKKLARVCEGEDHSRMSLHIVIRRKMQVLMMVFWFYFHSLDSLCRVDDDCISGSLIDLNVINL